MEVYGKSGFYDLLLHTFGEFLPKYGEGVVFQNDTAVRSSLFRWVAEVHWSATPSGRNACYLYFDNDGYVYTSSSDFRALGYLVRCIQSAD